MLEYRICKVEEEVGGLIKMVPHDPSLALNDTFVKLIAWYNNEWAFCRRLVELLIHMQAVEFGVNPDALL